MHEFDCKDGTKVITEGRDIKAEIRTLALTLQFIRDEWGGGLTVLSGFRTLTYNTSVGGETTSQHVRARAADIRPNDWTEDTTLEEKQEDLNRLYDTINVMQTNGDILKGGLSVYLDEHNLFVHVDTRGKEARW